MQLSVESVIHHVHDCSFGAVGSHSQHVPGFPFVTALPFVTDHHHRPIFLISKLAEHTKNILANPQGSFLMFKPKNGDVLAGVRVTMVGEITPIASDEKLTARFRRYQPEADDYLALQDFSFFCLEPQALRVIEGFGQMGWLDATKFRMAGSLDPTIEADLIQQLAADQPPHVRTLGLDPYGMDIEIKGQRERQRFPEVLLDQNSLAQAARRILQNFC